MNREDEFVEVALASARDVIGPPLCIERGKALLYRVTVDNRLKMTVDPCAPKRGKLGVRNQPMCFRDGWE